MNPIPLKLRKEMASDPFYSRCCITGRTAGIEKIDFHHNFIFAGRQVNEKWCILPLAASIHKEVHIYKERLNWIMLNRATDDQLRKYSKAINLIWLRDNLNRTNGVYKQRI